MENASKALIMAGSILMSVLVIGVLVLLYNQMSSLEQTKIDSETTVKVAQYLKKFEQYTNKNKTYYGSDILSLANLQEEYNNTQAGEKGYDKIVIKVQLILNNIEVNGYTYFKKDILTIGDITTGKNALEEHISDYEKDKWTKDENRTIAYYANRSYKEIALLFGYEYNDIKDMKDTEIISKFELDDKPGDNDAYDLYNEINNYKLLKSAYTEFKSKKFEIAQVETGGNNGIKYSDTTGRLIYLTFKEKLTY